MIRKRGAVHRMPADFRKALASAPKAGSTWNDITPLARNEWICWITSVKTGGTRREHVERACAELADGNRRLCCWPGCPHRRPKTAKWFKIPKSKI